MGRRILLAALTAALALPSLASAQPPDPSCVRSNQQTTATGAVLGALGGALIGNALGGRHSRGIDTVAGAGAGAVAGGALASTNNQPCPEGYYRPAPPPGYGPPPPPPPGYGPPEGAFWRGAPASIHERIDFLYQRINDAQAQGRLGRHDARMLMRQLGDIRNQEASLRYRDGGALTPPDRAFLQDRLNQISGQLHYEARD